MSIPPSQPHGVDDDHVAVLKLDADNLKRNPSGIRPEEDHPIRLVGIVAGIEGARASLHDERGSFTTDPMSLRRPAEDERHCIL